MTCLQLSCHGLVSPIFLVRPGYCVEGHTNGRQGITRNQLQLCNQPHGTLHACNH